MRQDTVTAPPVPLVVDLGAGLAKDASVAGGKALGLERLMAASLPCPPACVVTTAALDCYLDADGLRGRLAALLARAADEDARRELRTIAFEQDMPPRVDAALDDATRRLTARLPDLELLAVRSSAADEDGADHSFAGLHETELGVRLCGVAGAVRKCWASLWSPASVGYRAQHGLPLGEASMAVVFQALVPADASAVVFTVNPMTGATDEVVVQVTRGLGPTLVDNQVTPDTAVLAKGDLGLVSLEVGDKHLRVDCRPAGGIVRRAVAERAPAVSEEELRELAALAVEAERRLGGPVDVEAAFRRRWHLIQARPITTLRGAPVG